MRDELRRELKDQKVLEVGKERIEQLLREGQKRKTMLIKENSSIDEAIHSLETWIEAVEEHKKNSEEEKSTGKKDDQQKVDILAIPVDTYSAQMLALSSETAAIDDCIYFLDRSLVKGNITLDVFLKEVRKLSKRQFMAKVSSSWCVFDKHFRLNSTSRISCTLFMLSFCHNIRLI
jgi:ESCRT-I complex subunit TSG101